MDGHLVNYQESNDFAYCPLAKKIELQIKRSSGNNNDNKYGILPFIFGLAVYLHIGLMLRWSQLQLI